MVSYFHQHVRPAHSPAVSAAIWLYFHVLLILVVTSYLRISLAYVPARPVASPPATSVGAAQPLSPDRDPESGMPVSLQAWAVWSVHTFLPWRLRDPLPIAPSEERFAQIRHGVLHQCDSEGQLLRCWRDTCQGRFKPARYVQRLFHKLLYACSTQLPRRGARNAHHRFHVSFLSAHVTVVTAENAALVWIITVPLCVHTLTSISMHVRLTL